MAESDGQERTEEATPRRLQQARERAGRTLKELASASVLIVGAIALMWFGESLARSLFSIMSRLFDLKRDEIFDTTKLFDIALGAMTDLLFPMFLILITLFVAATIGAAGVGVLVFLPKRQCLSCPK